MDAGCKFFQQQMGDYNRDTMPNGYISGVNLRANAIRHESGETQSHYAQYVAANADVTKNPGSVAESMIARDDLKTQDEFLFDVDRALTIAINTIKDSTSGPNAPEPFGAEFDAFGEYQGGTNYTAYPGCHP
jgi:hypothetical protein